MHHEPSTSGNCTYLCRNDCVLQGTERHEKPRGGDGPRPAPAAATLEKPKEGQERAARRPKSGAGSRHGSRPVGRRSSRLVARQLAVVWIDVGCVFAASVFSSRTAERNAAAMRCVRRSTSVRQKPLSQCRQSRARTQTLTRFQTRNSSNVH